VENEAAARFTQGEDSAMTDVAVPLAEEAPLPAAEVETSFPELVWAHFRWEQELHAGRTPHPVTEARYRAALASFERKHGKILGAYWSTTRASAVAVTVKHAPRPLRWLGKDPQLHFHRATDWVTKESPPIADVMQRCETLAIRVSEVLRGTGEFVAMQWLLAVASHLLGFIDRADGVPSTAEARHLAREQLHELAKVEEYYDRAGGNAGRLVYFWGMMIGVATLTVLAPIVAGVFLLFDLYDAHTHELQTFFACYAAGALGALVSVMSRMNAGADKFSLDYEVGRNSLRRLGSFRPFLGAVFGVALYFTLSSGILQTETPPDESQAFFYYGTLAFVAGFSERWTKVILGGAERTIPIGSQADDADGEAQRARERERERRKTVA
jgi:hypothetical protein